MEADAQRQVQASSRMIPRRGIRGQNIHYPATQGRLWLEGDLQWSQYGDGGGERPERPYGAQVARPARAGIGGREFDRLPNTGEIVSAVGRGGQKSGEAGLHHLNPL
jgi:hypothetical protein